MVANVARSLGALTIGVVTRPFGFEGKRRAIQAEAGIERLRSEVDTLIVIPNDRLLSISDRQVSVLDAFKAADQVLLSGVQGITDLITTPGLINLDFADVKSVMSGAGSALMGIGSSRGEDRAVAAAEMAISSPLLEASIDGAHGVLLSIQGGSDLGLFEINEAAQLVANSAAVDANIIFGAVIDDALGDEVRVTVIAAGFDENQMGRTAPGADGLSAAALSPPRAPAPARGSCPAQRARVPGSGLGGPAAQPPSAAPSASSARPWYGRGGPRAREMPGRPAAPVGSSGPAAGAGSEVSADVAALLAAEVPTGENSTGRGRGARRACVSGPAAGTAVAGPGERFTRPGRARGRRLRPPPTPATRLPGRSQPPRPASRRLRHPADARVRRSGRARLRRGHHAAPPRHLRGRRRPGRSRLPQVSQHPGESGRADPARHAELDPARRAELDERLRRVRARIAAACAAAGRDAAGITLVAITKTRPACRRPAAVRAGPAGLRRKP